MTSESFGRSRSIDDGALIYHEVLISGRDGKDWTTVGVHENVVEASWHALVDALSYGLSHESQPIS